MLIERNVSVCVFSRIRVDMRGLVGIVEEWNSFMRFAGTNFLVLLVVIALDYASSRQQRGPQRVNVDVKERKIPNLKSRPVGPNSKIVHDHFS